MFGFGKRREDAILEELQRLREEVEALREEVHQDGKNKDRYTGNIASALRLLADNVEAQNKGNHTTTNVILGLARMMQYHFGHEREAITPFGSDPGQVS